MTRRGSTLRTTGTFVAALILVFGSAAGASPGRANAVADQGSTASAPGSEAEPESLPDTLQPEPTYTYLGTAPATPPSADPGTAATAAPFVAPSNTDFVFSYGANVSSAQRRVFEAAGGVWSDILDIQVPVRVAVRGQSLDPGVLGGASATDYWRDSPRFPVADVWFTSAQANQFAGRDLDRSVPEVDIVISTNYPFYEGTDASVPPDEISLLRLAIHEIAHGLGHSSFVRPVSGGFSANVGGSVSAYDRRIVDRSRRPIGSLSPAALSNAVQDQLLWSGPQASPGLTVKLHAPRPFVAGSSVSHLDESTYQTAILTPVLAPGEWAPSIGSLSAAMFVDMLWGLQSRSSDEAYTTALTLDFLNRYPTPAEQRAGAARVATGTSRDTIVRSYANSDEWLGSLVDGYYLSTLGRPADSRGRAYWIDQIRRGLPPADAAAYFYGSEEYFLRAGADHRAWVRDLYAEIVHRAADAGGLAYWTGLADRGVPRSTIALHFYQSLESRRDRVSAMYRRLLGRGPDSGGLAYWADVLTSGHDVTLAIYMAAGTEYVIRADRRFR